MCTFINLMTKQTTYIKSLTAMHVTTRVRFNAAKRQVSPTHLLCNLHVFMLIQ